jgi:CheY-like chemotaxis protein
MLITILLVEDSPTQAALSKRDLESLGYEIKVEVASSAVGAFQRVQACQIPGTKEPAPDLIILDMTLPDGSGLEICRALKSNPKTQPIPVIIFSVEALSTHRQAAYLAGANHYITKGGTGDTTLKLVASTLLRPKLKGKSRLGEALIARGYLNKDQLEQALHIQASRGGKLLGQLLVELGYITSKQLADTLEAQLKEPNILSYATRLELV